AALGLDLLDLPRQSAHGFALGEEEVVGELEQHAAEDRDAHDLPEQRHPDLAFLEPDLPDRVGDPEPDAVDADAEAGAGVAQLRLQSGLLHLVGVQRVLERADVGQHDAPGLAAAGARTVVIERARVGAEASTAAAGMVAPQAETAEDSPLLELALRGRDHHLALAPALEAETGLSVDLACRGLIELAFTGED